MHGGNTMVVMDYKYPRSLAQYAEDILIQLGNILEIIRKKQYQFMANHMREFSK